MVRRNLTEEEISQYKEELIGFDLLNNEVNLLQVAEILNEYAGKRGMSTLAREWGVKPHKVYELRKTIRREYGDDVLITSRMGRKVGESPNKNTEIVEKVKPVREKKAKKEKETATKQTDVEQIKELETLLARQEEELIEKNRVIEESKKKQELSSTESDDMKAMLELIQEQSEQIASTIYDVNKDKEPLNGIAFKFDGTYTASALKRRLGKIIHIVEGEASTFDIKFHVIENGVKDVSPEAGESVQNKLDDLTLTLLVHGEEIQEMKEEAKKLSSWREGYSELKSEKKGLHHPKSEYNNDKKKVVADKIEDEENIPKRSYIARHGIKCFQSFYHCPKCKDRDKTFTPKGSQYVNCKRCGEGMLKRDASEEGFPEVDSYGNIYIAGEFNRDFAMS